MAERLGIDSTSTQAWDPSLSTGVTTLDEQHKSLFECVELLAQAATEHSMLRTFYVMEQLSQYVHMHFAEEEFRMRVHGFPGLTDHIREHRTFTNRLHELRRIYLDRDISVDLVEMLRAWLMNHVAKTDMEYVPYLSKPPASPDLAAQGIITKPSQRLLPCFT